MFRLSTTPRFTQFLRFLKGRQRIESLAQAQIQLVRFSSSDLHNQNREYSISRNYNSEGLRLGGNRARFTETEKSHIFKGIVRRRNISMADTKMNMDKVLEGKYPAKEHARKVVEFIRSREPGAEGVLYLEAQKTVMIEDNDEAAPFRYVQDEIYFNS